MVKIAKLQNDKYYTPIELANHCWDKVLEIIGEEHISEIIEPSCGDGAFYHHPTHSPHFGYDIEPQCNFRNVIQSDFLTAEMNYLEGRLFIGNPPFGDKMWMAQKFYKKCCLYGDYIAFILPISQYQNDIRLYEFDLIYSEDLGMKTYTDRDLHCCFNIYKRPADGELNSKKDYTLKDITIVEHRRKKGDYATGKNKNINPDYDYAMCNWGNGCLGKVPEYIEQYSQEVYFYCHNKKFLSRMLELLEYETIREYCKSISAKKISVMKLYKYLKENIDGIE